MVHLRLSAADEYRSLIDGLDAGKDVLYVVDCAVLACRLAAGDEEAVREVRLVHSSRLDKVL